MIDIETLPFEEAWKARTTHNRLGAHHNAKPVPSAEAQEPISFHCACGWGVNVLNPR